MILKHVWHEAFETMRTGMIAYKYDYQLNKTKPKVYFIQLGADYATIRLTNLTKQKSSSRMLLIS